MGFNDMNGRADTPNNTSSSAQDSASGFRSFRVEDISRTIQAGKAYTQLEVILLSWLVVLLRTAEDGQASCDWVLEEGSNEKQQHHHLRTQDVISSLRSSVDDGLETLHQLIAKLDLGPSSSSLSLRLSTGPLDTASDEAKDNVIHLHVVVQDCHVLVKPVWCSTNVLPFTVTRHIETVVDTIRLCLDQPNASIEHCLGPTTHDLDQLWNWNHELPPTHDFCMHDVVSQQAQKHPDKVAISSWDGDLTYRQIDQYSTTLAHSLHDLGVKPHDFVPVCFEKSRWTIVAVLAVMKAGATMVLSDPTLPLARLQNMAKQVHAQTMISSPMQHDLAASILPEGVHVVVEQATFGKVVPDMPTTVLPVVPPSTLMYIIFTSGSTGTPKGVKISHHTYSSSALPRASAVGYTEESRVLDFASYAFDVSIDSMLLTLANGGCLCIPSDEDRLNDINGVIRRMRVNYAGITPSVARILDADVISSLSGLGLGGEAASATDVNLWGRDARIIIGYGPCECTIGCTINSDTAKGRDYISIGSGNGAAMWIVDPNDHDKLMPVGAVGELLVEGPIVGQGYLNDPAKTEAAFIHNPKWLVQGHGTVPGRQGRLYKTGDLGKFDPDGSGEIVFVGRKDTQVKLRGQRVELGEIESQLRTKLPSQASVIAEVIVPEGAGSQPTLVAFLSVNPSKAGEQAPLETVHFEDGFNETVTTANAEVSQILPRYMVPTVYIPINYIPTLISGKTDRKRLKEFGRKTDLRSLGQTASKGSGENTQLSELEEKLQRTWGVVLKVDPKTIRPDDNIFALGGDSLAAMKLVSACRESGLSLSVMAIFNNPTLAAMASITQELDSKQQQTTPEYSLINQNVESARVDASKACGALLAEVEDIYPCTPTQESLFTFSLKSAKAYVAQRVAKIPSHISIDAWKSAWEAVVAANAILRTRVAQLQDAGLQQVVLRKPVTWNYGYDLNHYLQNDRLKRMELGESLARYAIVGTANGQKHMVWTVHHVLYDGWSEPLILDQVHRVLQASNPTPQVPINDFVKFVQDTDETAMSGFWKEELDGATGQQFPRLPSRDYFPTPDAMVEHHIRVDAGDRLPFTPATLIRGAWALVASLYTGNSDVVFGETLTGRDIPLPGVEGIVGPLIATVPVRVKVDRSTSVEDYLQMVQQGTLARTPYQHMGMQNIRKVSHDAQYACETGTGLVIQPQPEYHGDELGFEQGDAVREALHFNPYPLMVGFGIQKGGFNACASFDSSLVGIAQMKRMLAQLEAACCQMVKGLSQTLEQISCIPDAELDQIWQWNQLAPMAFDEPKNRLRADAILQQGSTYPPAVVRWVCNPSHPTILSPIGCPGELWLEGSFLKGDVVELPSWLLAGSQRHVGREGKVQATGDLVTLQTDGSLVFVGRKENVVPIQGQAVDIVALETELVKHLAPATHAAAAVFYPLSDNGQSVSEKLLAVFVERYSGEDSVVQILPDNHTCILSSNGDDRSNTCILCPSFSVDMVADLKKVEKFCRNSMPAHMVPSAFVVVDKLPMSSTGVDHDLLHRFASSIPQSILVQLRNGLKQAWESDLSQGQLTPSETILQSAWAAVLRMDASKIDVDDNFFRMGGDSVLAMKMISNLRAQGYGLTVADVFQRMRLGDAAKVLKINQPVAPSTKQYKPFSVLGLSDKSTFVADRIQPKLTNPKWRVQDVLPVTDTQLMDVRATVEMPRTALQYTTLLFQHTLDKERLFRSWEQLVKRHDILRTIFIQDETVMCQVVLHELDIPVKSRTADTDIDTYVQNLCQNDIELQHYQGSTFTDAFLVQDNEGRTCFVLKLSHAQYDGISLPRLLRDLETLYSGGEIVDSEPFSTYMSNINDKAIQESATKYWRNLLDGSNLSVLKESTFTPGDRAIFHTKATNITQLPEGITTASLLTAAWGLVLARRLQTKDVTFGSVTSGRNVDMLNVENVMGPCYQLTPVRVSFKSPWSRLDFLRFVQQQTVESSTHDLLGFAKISNRCTQWPVDAQTFDSVVHHQDFEDFEVMPFAGGSCKVDIVNPHGDAPFPLKAVSFVQGGITHVGVVGSERDDAFVYSLLDSLTSEVESLVLEPSKPVHLGE